MNKTDGGILAAKGFKGGAAAAGIKAGSTKLDVALIWSEAPAKTAAVFTNNSVTAAPVQISKLHCRDRDVRAIVVNSGNANCMTGVKGRLDAERMARDAAAPLGIDKDEVLVASTGIIGRELPMDRIDDGIRAAYDARESTAAGDIARAIMTTDTRPKSVAYTREIGGKKVTIGGCAKGSGMIQPDMATMLCFLTTDAAIAPKLLDKALREAVRTTFNAITVDGCMSTNDTVAIIANGRAGNRAIGIESGDYRTFFEMLRQVCLDLALMVVRDGEGATMLVVIDVKGAKDYDQAKAIGYAVANSSLVKTATRAKTDNWGRIAQAVGALGLDIDENSLEIEVSKKSDDELKIAIKVELGKAEATVYTCDLTKEYVDINVEYN